MRMAWYTHNEHIMGSGGHWMRSTECKCDVPTASWAACRASISTIVLVESECSLQQQQQQQHNNKHACTVSACLSAAK